MIKIEVSEEKWKQIEEKHLRFVQKYILKSDKKEIIFSDHNVQSRIAYFTQKYQLDLKEEVFISRDLKKYAFTSDELFPDDYLILTYPSECSNAKELKHKRKECVDIILDAFGYKRRFSDKDGVKISNNELWGRHEYLNMLDVHICPYCGRQYITSYGTKKKKWSTADMDHYYTKAMFPLLSLNIYNMIPSCSICNSRFKLDKVQRKDQVHLYPYEDSSDCIKFGVDLDSFDALYRVNKDDIHLEIKVIQEKEKSENSIDTFKLNEIYDEHRGCAYDIIQKMNAYSEEKFNQIFSKDFANLFSNYEELERCMFDFLNKDYLDEPLVKMKKDIYEQVKSIF